MTNSLRVLGIALLAVAVCLAIVGTGGFSSTAADRSVTVEVAEDESAYVGYDSPEEISIDANESETVRLVILTNRFHVEFDITDVDVDAPDSLTVRNLTGVSESAPVGETIEIKAELACDDSFDNKALSVTVRVDSGDVETEVLGDVETRNISVTCEG